MEGGRETRGEAGMMIQEGCWGVDEENEGGWEVWIREVKEEELLNGE